MMPKGSQSLHLTLSRTSNLLPEGELLWTVTFSREVGDRAGPGRIHLVRPLRPVLGREKGSECVCDEHFVCALPVDESCGKDPDRARAAFGVALRHELVHGMPKLHTMLDHSSHS